MATASGNWMLIDPLYQITLLDGTSHRVVGGNSGRPLGNLFAGLSYVCDAQCECISWREAEELRRGTSCTAIYRSSATPNKYNECSADHSKLRGNTFG